MAAQSDFYVPLNRDTHEIRLIHIHEPPNAAEMSIHCSLETVSLDSEPKPNYIALSYCWGQVSDAKNGVPLYVNGTLFNTATLNLHLALFHFKYRFRQQGNFIRIWADAICINQQDEIERGHQVSYMNQIYNSAESVWCWLQPNFQMLDQTNAVLRFLEEVDDHTYANNDPDDTLPKVSIEWLVPKLKDKSICEGLVWLFSQQYWKRSWIIQEIAVAKQSYLFHGTSVVPLRLLLIVLISSSDIWGAGINESVPEQIMDHILEPSTIAQFVTKFSPNPSQGLMELMGRFKASLATDARDKVYSLLGIARQYEHSTLAVDYTLDWRDVFRNTTMYIMEGSRRLDILVWAASQSPELPSWAPDFSIRPTGIVESIGPVITSSYFLEQFRSFDAGKDYKPISTRNDSLMMKVILLGQIQELLPTKVLRNSDEYVEEVGRRLEFLIDDYMKILDPDSPLNKLMTIKIISLLYSSTFTSSLIGNQREIWSPNRFFDFCGDYFTNPNDLHLTKEVEIGLLGQTLRHDRSMFIINLPPPFSLNDVQVPIPLPTTPDELEMLKNLPFHVPGYCRNEKSDVKLKDYVAIIPGCSIPLILRLVSEPDIQPIKMKLISEAYVHQIMFGEAIGILPEVDIELV